ncbi:MULTISPECIES: NAD-dependent epimerase/dehydratase family protein [Achromobacter]|uniref:NAD-dependent epimerase/dehydratase family protein n=1 Tax=Achromobacter spanius TaxID=217203 RepID=A0ABY8GVA2_9BURK|nr:MULTISPECIES: NAD-dependent epimerase/dehydratase family protein [Achromobacter]WAI81961.1 NAD-dependent epimerase/dehydratase family protein [Achromobacter spanius]WEX92049.1 NAD-dependent epimerase/dehydratase family protein [Achromobacter sp. SS2-2022]WFP08803.1 NAD-dependent epimerase/dehydratase family protein [Achromobacter spanius]
MNKQPVTVLGATGFIGRHLVARLRTDGTPCQAPPRHDPGLMTRPLGHVIYAIGLTSDFRSRPLDTVEAHVCLLRSLLAAGNFDSLTYLSSTRVYAGSADTRESATLAVNPNDPSDLYNLSKLMGESLCLHCGRRGAKVARLSNIVGLRDTPDSFIDQLLEEGARGNGITLRTSLSSRKDYLYIDDAVSQILAIAQSEDASGIFNVAHGASVDNREVAHWLQQALGYRCNVAPGSPEWAFAAVDVSRIQALCGVAPRAFSDYFPNFLAQYRLHKGI